jgi:predicted nuclease of restriction endonuclease-like (RecB) superfamily
MNYLDNIKNLIENDIVLRKKHRLQEENNRLKTYFEIGKLIVDAQGGEKRARYGNGLIKEWSMELTRLYGKGYDSSNLKRMRQLYLTFQNGGTLCHLSWSHLRYILPIKNESKRNYYINLCIKQNLSVRQLIEKIKSKEYERLEYKDKIEILKDNNESLTIKDMIKNPIIINTNKNMDKLSEKALKSFILESIEKFLLELGVGFTYCGSEYKLGRYKCDLLLFNTELSSYVVIELKIRELKPIDIGQINYYMKYIDNNIKKEYMEDTIGIIMSKENNEIIIKYITSDKILFTTYKIVKA